MECTNQVLFYGYFKKIVIEAVELAGKKVDLKQFLLIHYFLKIENEKKDVEKFYFGIQNLKNSKKDANTSAITN